MQLFGSKRKRQEGAQLVSLKAVRLSKGEVTEQDILQLHVLMKGTPHATPLLRAQALFGRNDYCEAKHLVEAARDFYQKKHQPTLDQEAQGSGGRRMSKSELGQLKQRKEKINGVLGEFKLVLDGLGIMISQQPESERGQHSAPVLDARTIVDSGTVRWGPDYTQQVDTSNDDSSWSHKEIDKEAFSQLAAVVQQAALMSGGAKDIERIRDTQFGRKDYQRAYESLTALSRQFSALAEQRLRRLKIEDDRIKIGKTDLTRQQIVQKRRRDVDQTQKINRVPRHFTRVLSGLQILIRVDSD